ncbi:potassium voltage-gated channel subfamily V member 1 isoform X3 [Austrofundulus limnaeus]|uniref:Potassium voltage-gated channel subfamily V member 1 isoform X3 n=1 Tax=Austrofundulus limnaeus TaxID=52670 RepID=A0A2I4DC26_AUSLI|nr:PREDICTED: potassium voltage-gated channel subfamily V member 1 isoform X3 [Austrofundulus limnaeus]
MNFYKTGHLHVMEELCEISFQQEIEYWGIEEVFINSCCRERYHRRKELKESLDLHPVFQPDNGGEDFIGAFCPTLRRRLWDLLERPETSRAAQTFGSLSVFFVVVSVINMVLISLDLEEDFGVSWLGLGVPLLLDGVEYMCVVWFTVELVLRFLCVRDKCRFSRSIPNVIDLLAILPFYVTLAVESLHGGSTKLENMSRVVQVLRLLRSLRMLKLSRHLTGKHSRFGPNLYPQVQHKAVLVQSNTRLSWFSPTRGCPGSIQHKAVLVQSNTRLSWFIPARGCPGSVQHKAVLVQSNTRLSWFSPTQSCPGSVQHKAALVQSNMRLSWFSPTRGCPGSVQHKAVLVQFDFLLKIIRNNVRHHESKNKHLL